MVAPDRHLGDVADRHLGLLGQLRQGPVMVQPSQRTEPFGRDVGRIVHGDERIGIGRIPGHTDADIVGGDCVEGLALGGEDRTIGFEEVAALHALRPGPSPDEQGEVDAVEDMLGRIADLNRVESGKGTVVEFHDHTFEGGQGRCDFQQAQLNWSLGAEKSTAGNAEEETVADLTGRTGDSDFDGSIHRMCSLTVAGFAAGDAGRPLVRIGPLRSSA